MWEITGKAEVFLYHLSGKRLIFWEKAQHFAYLLLQSYNFMVNSHYRSILSYKNALKCWNNTKKT